MNGSGTVNFLSKFTASQTLGDSIVSQSAGGNVGIGMSSPTAKLHVNGDMKTESGILAQGSIVTTASGVAIFASGSNAEILCQDDITAVGDIEAFGDLTVGGDLYVTGTKNFVQPHPEDMSKAIVYHCAEGPEPTVETHGRALLRNGMAVVRLPESYRFVADPNSLSVLLTPHADIGLFVESVDVGKLIIRERGAGRSTCEVSWQVLGRRAMIEKVPDIRFVWDVYDWTEKRKEQLNRAKAHWHANFLEVSQKYREQGGVSH